jgi:predicted porin
MSPRGWRSSCAGTLDTFSFLVNYRPRKRIDVYAAVALANVHAGLANGFQQTQNIDPAVGLRIKF